MYSGKASCCKDFWKVHEEEGKREAACEEFFTHEQWVAKFEGLKPHVKTVITGRCAQGGFPVEDYLIKLSLGLSWCCKCRLWKQRGKFSVKASFDGTHAWCKSCRARASRDRSKAANGLPTEAREGGSDAK